MTSTTVLISGAGIAGPALAFWLHRHGFAPTIVERARALRVGGQAVDFRGEAHLGVLRKMGILEQVRARRTDMGEQTFVDGAGRPLVRLPAVFMSGDLEIQRGDLCQILYDATRSTTEYCFGDAITALVETDRGVEVSFERAAPRTFDLVIGADGLHSGVRALAFGEESRFLRFLGYHVAAFTLPNQWGLVRRGLTHSVPGRAVCLSSARAPAEARALLVFASPPLAYDRRDLDAQKAIVRDTFAGMGWETPRVLAALERADDLYFDAVARIELDTCARGRIALLGDAAFGGTLGGQGTGAAIIGAYVLAGELAAARGDHRAAFARYDQRIRAYATRCQNGAAHAGPFFAPRSRARLWLRNAMYRVLSSRAMAGVMRRLVTSAADAIALPDYAT
ncbi:MAG: FAD-dependent monooxygenase [Deltaproteobacteria bacterium]|nr:FAD-dependent monooxygenase [Deltaproteobacteria bacterium]